VKASSAADGPNAHRIPGNQTNHNAPVHVAYLAEFEETGADRCI
jgi:hypothetical protein